MTKRTSLTSKEKESPQTNLPKRGGDILKKGRSRVEECSEESKDHGGKKKAKFILVIAFGKSGIAEQISAASKNEQEGGKRRGGVQKS